MATIVVKEGTLPNRIWVEISGLETLIGVYERFDELIDTLKIPNISKEDSRWHSPGKRSADGTSTLTSGTVLSILRKHGFKVVSCVTTQEGSELTRINWTLECDDF